MKNEKEWRERISEALRTFGFDGEVSIEVEPETDELLISHPDFGCPFTGVFSKDGNYLSVLTIDHYTQEPEDAFERHHCEAIVFDASTFEPLYYSIYREPENQKIMMSDFGIFKKGNILYENYCPRGYFEKKLDEPVFESDVFDIHVILP